jgi:hypothetical protein
MLGIPHSAVAEAGSMKSSRWAVVLFAAALCVTVLIPGTTRAQPVILGVEVDQDYDSVLTGEPMSIIFTVDANGANISAITYPLRFTFSNGNIIGPISVTGNVTDTARFSFSPQAYAVFENLPFNGSMGLDFVDEPADTILFGSLDFDESGWTGPGEWCRIEFVPLDTGTIVIDGTFLPPASGMSVTDQSALPLPYTWEPATINIPRQPGTVKIRAVSSYGNDSLYIGGQGSIIFTVDWAGHEIAGVTFPLQAVFSNGNIIGPFSEPPSVTTAEFIFSPYAKSVFENTALNHMYATNFTHAPADTILFGGIDFGDGGWTESAEIARLRFYPLDTGTITLDEVLIPPTSGLVSAVDPDGQPLAVDWQPVTFAVTACPVLMGDVNQDGVVQSSDLIYMVNYIFKSGPEPIPIRAVGDVNCTGGLGGSDIIFLVNYMFKGGSAPCACYERNI